LEFFGAEPRRKEESLPTKRRRKRDDYREYLMGEQIKILLARPPITLYPLRHYWREYLLVMRFKDESQAGFLF
jgi:hypothetical protein